MLVCWGFLYVLVVLGLGGGMGGWLVGEGGGGLGGNWFSAENSLRVYSQYLELDKNQNGLLAKEEVSCGVGKV